jgi:RND family efflux transporter MFP subunit
MAGCNRAQSQNAGAPPPPEVIVGMPVTRLVTDFNDFPGRTEAVKGIDVRARVQGYLDKVLFKEGADVKEGDALFIIDPRTYKADYDRAAANLALAKAHLTRTEADFRRAKELLPMKAIAKSDFDLAQGDRDEAAATVEVAEAALHTSKLNLDFTTVTAPIGGRISRQNIDPGNLVLADNTILTTIVSLDPIYAYFDVDERTVLKFRELVREGKVKTARDSVAPVFLGLSNEEGFPHEGVINFVDNKLDVMTGTLRIRGVFRNPDGTLSPGMFARIRTLIGTPHEAILVSERALGSDQGEKFVYVLNKKNAVEYRRVQVGALQDGLREVVSGVDKGERIVLDGLQRIKPGITVTPKNVKMTAEEPYPVPKANKPPDKPATAAATTAQTGSK